MGIGLRVKREVFLTKADSLALEKAARVKRRSQSSVIREALVEWLSARGLLHEEEEAQAPPAPTLGELLETERQKIVPGNERHG
jgi:Arc/MetJ-type ribon-helix-helix transcriptional regulator